MGPSARRFGWLLAIVVALAAACGDPAVPPVPVAPSGTIAAPEITCLGVVPAKCREIVGDIQGGNPDNQPVAIRIVCTTAPCTELAGQVSIDLVGADGTRSSSGMGWATAGGGGPLPPVPQLPTPAPQPAGGQPASFPPGIVPTCVGLPAASCAAMARSVLEGLPSGATLASITVACTETCDLSSGRGRTVVVFADGSTTTEDWAYGN